MATGVAATLRPLGAAMLSLAIPFAVSFTASLTSCTSAMQHQATSAASSTWEQRLAERLPVLGHRNWVVVADSAYPSQCSPGVETIYAGGNQLDVLRRVLAAVDGARHVRPDVVLDAELQHVADADAPGIAAYRAQLRQLLGTRPVQVVPHEEVIHRLDEAAKTFSVLLIKTDMTLPYTSVFLELGCGYWSPEQEQRLRESMRGAENRR